MRRLHDLIERTPNSFRYRVTDFRLRVALLFTQSALRPGLAAALSVLRDRTAAGIFPSALRIRGKQRNTMLNWVAAALLAFTIFSYFVIYTTWLKRSTPRNIVISGSAT